MQLCFQELYFFDSNYFISIRIFQPDTVDPKEIVARKGPPSVDHEESQPVFSLRHGFESK